MLGPEPLRSPPANQPRFWWHKSVLRLAEECRGILSRPVLANGDKGPVTGR